MALSKAETTRRPESKSGLFDYLKPFKSCSMPGAYSEMKCNFFEGGAVNANWGAPYPGYQKTRHLKDSHIFGKCSFFLIDTPFPFYSLNTPLYEKS